MVARISDVIAVIALFALLTAGFWVAAGAGLPAGGDQLLLEVGQ